MQKAWFLRTALLSQSRSTRFVAACALTNVGLGGERLTPKLLDHDLHCDKDRLQLKAVSSD